MQPLPILPDRHDRKPICSQGALLRKSAEGRSIPSPRQTYPARFVIGVPRVVKRFRIAALI